MVWYISNVSDQPDHCSKHQLRRKISEKKLSKRRLLQKEMNKGWCRSVYVHLTVLSSGRCSVFVLKQASYIVFASSPTEMDQEGVLWQRLLLPPLPPPSERVRLPSKSIILPNYIPFDPKPSHIGGNMNTLYSTNLLLQTIYLPSTQKN